MENFESFLPQLFYAKIKRYTKLQLESAKVKSQKEFLEEQELKEKQRKLDEINAELKINDDDHEILLDEQEKKEDTNRDKNAPERC